MPRSKAINVDDFAANALEVADMLRALGNERLLMMPASWRRPAR